MAKEPPMKTFFLRFFTWWNGQTFGTQLWTWRFGELVGQDEFGNRYFRTRGGKIDPTLLMERRWVIYNGEAEASSIPPSWHGWMHHTVDVPPTEERYQPRPWQKPHRPNLTGTPGAHRPTGSTWRRAGGRRRPATTRLGIPAARRLPDRRGCNRCRPFPAAFRVLTGHRPVLQATSACGRPKPADGPIHTLRDADDCGPARRLAGARAVSEYLRQHLRQSAAAAAVRCAGPSAVALRPAAAAICSAARRRRPAARTAAELADPDPAAAAAARRRQPRRRGRPRPARPPAAPASGRQHSRQRSRLRSPPPNNETIVEPPPNKIANPTAVFSGLDKITGRIISFDVAINETVRFGALEVTPRACYSRPPTEAPTTDGFIEVDELTLQGELKRIFSGWMFAASPGLNAVEHPIYDVWLTDCKGAPQPRRRSAGRGAAAGAAPTAARRSSRRAAGASRRRSSAPRSNCRRRRRAAAALIASSSVSSSG